MAANPHLEGAGLLYLMAGQLMQVPDEYGFHIMLEKAEDADVMVDALALRRYVVASIASGEEIEAFMSEAPDDTEMVDDAKRWDLCEVLSYLLLKNVPCRITELTHLRLPWGMLQDIRRSLAVRRDLEMENAATQEQQVTAS